MIYIYIDLHQYRFKILFISYFIRNNYSVYIILKILNIDIILDIDSNFLEIRKIINKNKFHFINNY